MLEKNRSETDPRSGRRGRLRWPASAIVLAVAVYVMCASGCLCKRNRSYWYDPPFAAVSANVADRSAVEWTDEAVPITQSAAGFGQSPIVHLTQRPPSETALASAESAYALAQRHEQNGSSTCVDHYYRSVVFSWQSLRTNGFCEGDPNRPCRANELYTSSLAKRVVFIATPHDGSPWAVRPVGRISAGLVNYSPEDDERWQGLMRDNPGVFEPSIRRQKPTSVALLRQGNPLLTAMQQLRISPNVQLHSIIGTGRPLFVAGPADGVVPVRSARHPGVHSELYVPATHTSIQRHPATIREVERILLVHLAEFDAGT